VVDVVTTRQANLHRALMERLGPQRPDGNADRPSPELYAAAYLPIGIPPQINLDIWYESFDIGASLPTLPLWLDGNLCVPLMLQDTYEQTCRSQRITAA
jgi:hypothetical protein